MPPSSSFEWETAAPYALALPNLRSESTAGTANLIGGHPDNAVGGGLQGVTVTGGGGPAGQRHQAIADFAAISGGRQNAAGAFSFVGGGEANRAHAGSHAVVAGGLGDDARGGASAVVGGSANDATGNTAFIGAGVENTAGGTYSVAAGGFTNFAAGLSSTVPGGDRNQAGGDFSLAAGRRAIVRAPSQVGNGDIDDDEGCFVWADSNDVDFQSTGPDQFLIRAAGGVGINKTDPKPGALDVDGEGLFSDAVGIGTARPTRALTILQGGMDVVDDVGEGISLTTDAFRVSRAVNEDPGYEYDGRTDTHRFFSQGSPSLTISRSARVGIGTDTPTARLEIGGVPGTDGIRFPDGSLQTKAFRGNALDAADGSPTDAVFVSAIGKVGIGTTTPNSALHVIGEVEIGGSRLHVGSDGSVGIGTVNPQSTLHVAGEIRTDSGGIRFPNESLQVRAANVLRGSFTIDFSSIAAGATTTANVGPVSNMDATSVVYVSPDLNWPDGLVVGFCRAVAEDTFQVKVMNITSAPINPPSVRFEFVVCP